MSPVLQSILAPLVVLAALGYLVWSHRRAKSGCSSGAGECACPKPPADLRRSLRHQ